jgi:hypothetical protein
MFKDKSNLTRNRGKLRRNKHPQIYRLAQLDLAILLTNKPESAIRSALKRGIELDQYVLSVIMAEASNEFQRISGLKSAKYRAILAEPVEVVETYPQDQPDEQPDYNPDDPF